jgi:hypothetical protein
MNNVTIRISNSCKIPSNSTKALVFGTRCGNSNVFSIPISQILEAKEAVIKNEDRSYPAQELTITFWIYDKIKPDLDKMSDFNYKLITK